MWVSLWVCLWVSMCPCMCPCMCEFVCDSVFVSLCLSVCVSVCLSVCLSIVLTTILRVSFLCLCWRSSVWVSFFIDLDCPCLCWLYLMCGWLSVLVSLPVCLWVSGWVCMSVYMLVWLCLWYVSVCVCVCLSVCVSERQATAYMSMSAPSNQPVPVEYQFLARWWNFLIKCCMAKFLMYFVRFTCGSLRYCNVAEWCVEQLVLASRGK